MKKLYHNGIIRTMHGDQIVAAVLTQGGRILAAGSDQALAHAAPDAERIDLGGSTMLPAFIDAHSHFSSYAMSFLQVPLEGCSSFDEIAEQIMRFRRENRVKPGEWIIAKGYDHMSLAEKMHPTLALLQACAPDNPLVLQHASGHVGVMNAMALARLGITPNTPQPAGGRIGMAGGALTGYLEENAFISCLQKIPMNSIETMVSAYQRAQRSYAAHGITTIQEGMTVGQLLPLYQYLLERKLLTLDVVAYLAPQAADLFFAAFPDAVGAYRAHFKIGGYKIILDGSPQGRTAWMRTPYQKETPPYYGYGTMSDAAVLSAVRTAASHKMQLLAHCNGDAAADQLLRAVEAVQQESALLRPVMIHAQLLGIDQLDRVKKLGVLPSFFVAHVYHWGDTHIENFGKARAASISPANAALARSIRFTFHQDTPVIAPDMLETVWCAVNRITKDGVILGAGERISALEALKAVTIHAAYQHSEEQQKGSIEPGKAADFVILDRDPLSVDPMDIRSIQVLQTIKSGKCIYDKRSPSR